jgi:radical SAM superfamily enzyme YgiQ (UPF0313 family)
MKILYVNPGRIEAGLDAIIKGPPLALLAIAAMAPEHDATLFDFKVDKYHEKKFRTLLRAHDVCAISSMTPQIYHALEVAQMAKEEGCTTIIGGYHPSLKPGNVAKNSQIDFTVRGEGEHTFREIIEYLDGNKNNLEKSDILGISFRDNDGVVIHNPARPLEPNLDNFPIPRRELLKGKHYQYMGTRVNLMETSRGCPHNCSFCCIIKMWDDDTHKVRYRTKSIGRIIKEVYTIDRNDWDFVFFNDDNFTIDVKRTDKILDALIKSNLSSELFFSCQSRVDTLSRNPWLAKKMAKAGFRNIFLGIESVHQQSLDAMGKNTNKRMIQKACKMCTDEGIAIFGGMIVGFPGETKKMVNQNIDFAISLKLDFVQFTPITAFPGTEFFKEMQEKNMISTYNYKYYNLFHPMMRTEHLSRNEMHLLVSKAYAKYYMQPSYLKMMFQRALFNQKFKWYKKISYRWLKQFVGGGWNMLHSQGITFELAKSDIPSKFNPNVVGRRAMLKERYLKFKYLLQNAKNRKIVLKNPKLLQYAKV